jgi:hypothetical protein
MSLFSPSEIQDLRALALSAMADVVAITHVTHVAGGGSWTETTTTTTTVGRLELGGGAEAQTADQIQERGQYRLHLPTETLIDAKDRVVVGGRTFEVVWTPTTAAWAPSRVVGLRDSVKRSS